MKSWSRRSSTALAAAVAGLLAHPAAVNAAELSYGVDVGAGYSDNVTRVSDDEQSETIASLGAQLRLDHESSRLKANVASRFEYREYLDDTYDSEVVGNLIGNALFDIVKERFSWTITDTFGQTTQNQFAPATPENRENVNYLTTGPDFSLPLGSRNKLIVHGRYIDVDYEDSDLGNQRVRGELALRRDLSDATNISLNVTTEQVSFDNEEQFSDFDTDEVFANYTIDAARTTLSIDAGATEITVGDASDSGWLGRVSLTRRASPSLTFGLDLGHEFSDAGNLFAHLQTDQPGSVDPVPVQQTATPFENDYITASARFQRNRTGLELRVGYHDESYDAQPLFDRKRSEIEVALNRQLSSVLSGHLRTGYSRQEFAALDREFSDLSATLGVRWSIGRATFLNVDYVFLDRNDDAEGAGYRANEVWLRFGYLVGEGAGVGSFGGL